jgi:hypothetical protein
MYMKVIGYLYIPPLTNRKNSIAGFEIDPDLTQNKDLVPQSGIPDSTSPLDIDEHVFLHN